MIEPGLFKKYDIRGRAQGQDAPLNPLVAGAIGRAAAPHFAEVHGKHVVVVGRDNRLSSPELAAALINGLRAGGAAGGATVVNLGLVPTPLVYWYAVQYNNAGGIMVTGSHLGPEQNGFKLCVGAVNIFGDELLQLRDRIAAPAQASPNTGQVTSENAAIRTYQTLMHHRLRQHMLRPLTLVIDAGNGTGGLVAAELFERWGHTVHCLFCEPDGTFPNHQPDPQVAANMRALGARVRETGADLGIGFDGDADRLGVVDERGELIAADRVLALLAQDMLARRPRAAVVADVLSSQTLFDAVTRAGGRAVMWASGHSLVKAKMREIGALLGGEASGHIFLAEDYYGFDDAFLAAGRLLALLTRSEVSLSALNAALPAYASTPEYRPHCPDARKQAVIDGVRQALLAAGDIALHDVIAVDGIRVQFPRGWGLLRASHTEPVLSLRFEGVTEADAHAYRDRFFTLLAQYAEVELPTL
jgi:phosphomannomutase/phosphoglucomutase